MIGRCLVAAFFLPHYFRGELFTSYEVLARRFGGATQQLASLLFVVTRTLSDGLRLFLTALVVQEMTGWSLAWAVVATGATTLAYTYFGGMNAVLWTDLVQFVIYVGGALIAFCILLGRLPGGFAEVAGGGRRGRQAALLRRQPLARRALHPVGRPLRRRLRGARLARGRPADGAALPLRQKSRRRQEGAGVERLPGGRRSSPSSC